MRKLQIILLVMFGSYLITTAQNMSKMDDELQQEIVRHERGDKLRINPVGRSVHATSFLTK